MAWNFWSQQQWQGWGGKPFNQFAGDPNQDQGIQQASVYDGRMGGEANKIRYQIVNSVPHKAPYFQNSYKDESAINAAEKWSPDYRYMKKRKWLTPVSQYPWYELVDDVIVDGTSYYLGVSYDRTQVKLFEQVGLDLVDLTDPLNTLISDIDFKYYYGLSEKLCVSFFPGWDPRRLFMPLDHSEMDVWTSDNGYMNYDESVWYWLEDDTVTTDGGMLWSNEIVPGDYIYIYRSWVWGSGDSAQIAQVINDSIGDNKPRLIISWDWNISTDNPKTGKVSYIVFPRQVETIMFATAKWIVQYHLSSLNNKSVITPTGAFYWSKEFQVSSIKIHKENLYAMEANTWRVYFWNFGIKKNFVKALDYMDVWRDYKRLYTFQDYLLLIWPTKLWGVSQQFDSSGKAILNFLDFINEVWAWCEWSYQEHIGQFYIVASDRNFYSFSIIVNYYSKPQVRLDPQSTWIIDQLRTADRNRGQKIFLDIDANWVKLFLTEITYPNLNNQNTKIFFYDNFYKFRYSWMIPWINICGRSWDFWYWGKVYMNTWETDEWQELRQIFVWVFGADTPTSEKFFITSKLLVGQESRVTEWNTVIRLKLTHEGRTRVLNNAYMWNSEYMTLLAKMQWGDTEDVVYDMPDGTRIIQGNYNITDPSVFENEFINYKNYINAPIETTYFDPFEEQIGRFGCLERWLAQYANVAIYEIVCLGTDKLSFGGCAVVYTYTDTDTTRLDNVLSVDLPTN